MTYGFAEVMNYVGCPVIHTFFIAHIWKEVDWDAKYRRQSDLIVGIGVILRQNIINVLWSQIIPLGKPFREIVEYIVDMLGSWPFFVRIRVAFPQFLVTVLTFRKILHFVGNCRFL